MADWLTGEDHTDGSYLGLDDPAMPDGAPAPPSAPTATATEADPWLSGGGNDGWLGTNDAPAHGSTAAGGTVMDTQGDWLAADPALAAAPEAPAPQRPEAWSATPAPAAPIAYGADVTVAAPQLEDVRPSPRSIGGTRGELSDLVLEVEVQVEVGLGNAALTVEEFLEMGRGSVVELDTPVDAPIELRVRGKLIARGQLVSINGSYGMRIIEMTGEEH